MCFNYKEIKLWYSCYIFPSTYKNKTIFLVSYIVSNLIDLMMKSQNIDNPYNYLILPIK